MGRDISVRQHSRREHWAPCHIQASSRYDWKIVESDVNPNKTVWRVRLESSVGATAQPDQSLRWRFMDTQGNKEFTRRANTLIRLTGCSGLSESSLATHYLTLRWNKRNGYTLGGWVGATVFIYLPSFWKGVYFKRKEFAPLRSKFFPFRVDSFSEGFWCAAKQTIIKIVPLIQNGGKASKCTQFP